MSDAARTNILGELATGEELRTALGAQTLRLNVRLGVKIAAGIVILGTLQALA